MKARTRRLIAFFAVLLMISAWIIFLSFVSPGKIVAELGVRNGYTILFIVSAIGGVSSITASSYYIFVSVLAAGGLNPLFLGIIGGFGVTIGDSLFFYFGTRARKVSPENISKKSEKLSSWIKKQPRWTIPFLVFIYASFTPFPNDIMTVSLGFLEYPYKKMIFPLLIGNMSATIILAYLSSIGYNILV